MNEYEVKLKKYNFKTIVEYISTIKLNTIDDCDLMIGNLYVNSTDWNPDNEVTRIGLVMDAISLCKKKDGKKTINKMEFYDLCKLSNKYKPVDNKTYEGIIPLIAKSKEQSILQLNDRSYQCLIRDYYIFSWIDDIFINSKEKHIMCSKQ